MRDLASIVHEPGARVCRTSLEYRELRMRAWNINHFTPLDSDACDRPDRPINKQTAGGRRPNIVENRKDLTFRIEIYKSFKIGDRNLPKF